MMTGGAMNIPKLFDVKDIAAEWNVAPDALMIAAGRANLLVQIGRSRKIYENDLERLVRECQGQAKERASTGESRPKQEPDSGLSSTVKRSAKQAQQIADRLTKRLPTTSTQGASSVTPIRPKHS